MSGDQITLEMLYDELSKEQSGLPPRDRVDVVVAWEEEGETYFFLCKDFEELMEWISHAETHASGVLH